jgi:HK97 family phage major capsid protein
MGTDLLTKYRDERSTLESQIEAIMGRDDFDPSSKDFTEARGSADALDSKIKSIIEWNGRKQAANEIDAISVRHRQDQDQKQTREESAGSIGEAWVRSKQYSAYKDIAKGNSGVLSLPFEMIQERAPLLTTTFPGIVPKTRIQPSEAPARQTPFLDLINTIQVTTGSVEWIYYPASGASGADVVAEGAVKPEGAITPELRTVTLETIAVWVQFSRQFSEDSDALITFLNAALRRGIQDKREALAVAALLADASIPVTANTGTLLEGVRLGIAAVESAGFRSEAVVINPADAAAFDLEVMNGTLRGPVANGSFWGVPIIPIGAIPTGTAYVGDFGTAMAELVRNEIQTFTTDSHASTFTSNILTHLLECRVKAIVHRAEAVTKVSGTVLAAASQSAGRK